LIIPYDLNPTGQAEMQRLITVIQQVSNGVKSMEKYLRKVVSLHIKAIFVMTSALMLEADKKITKKKSKAVFRG